MSRLLIAYCVIFVQLHGAFSAPQACNSRHNSLKPCCSAHATDLKHEITIGVLLPTVEVNGKLFNQPIRAVLMAVDEINDRSDILPNTRICVVVNSTSYDRWQAVQAALWQVNVANVAAIIGGSDASEAKLIATITREASVPLLSPLDVEFESDLQTLYPTLFRVGDAYDRLRDLIQDVLEQFGWRNVTVIHSDEDYGFYGVRYAIEQARAAGYHINSVYLQQPHNDQLTENEKKAIYTLRDDRFRIFVVVLHPEEQAAVLRIASEAGMFASGYAWVITHCNYGTDLFNETTMDGIICIRQQTNDTAIGDLWNMMQNSSYSGDETSMWLSSVYAYNAVHALSRVMNMSQNSTATTTSPSATIQPKFRPKPSFERQTLFNVLANATFYNQTGTLLLRHRHQTSNYSFFNYHKGELSLFATRNANNFSLVATTLSSQLVYFPGGTNTVPPDFPVEHYKTLNALVPISFPFTDYVNRNSNTPCQPEHNETNCEFRGVAIDLIRLVANKLGIEIKLTTWNDTWNKLVEEVGNANNSWHLAVGSVTVTEPRRRLANFSSSIFDGSLRILVHKATKRSYFEFFQPFRWSVWLLIIITLIVASGVILFLDPDSVDNGFAKKHPNAGKWNCRIHLVSEAVYFVCCLFFYVHRVDDVNRLFARVYVIMLCFWALIMVSAFTANMASFFTSQQQDHTISNFRQLIGRKVGCRKGTSNWNYLINELSFDTKYLVDIKHPSEPHEALGKLKSGSIEAYIGDTHHVKGLAASDCDVVVTGPQEQPQKYAFPMKSNLWYRNQINKVIQEALQEKFVLRAFDRHLNSTCPPVAEQEDNRKITSEDSPGLFILSCGLGFFLILLKGIYLSWRWWKKRQMRNTVLPS